MAKIFDQLRRAMKRSGKSRYAISKETGITEAALSRFANGKTGMAVDNIEKICDCIGVKLSIVPKRK